MSYDLEYGKFRGRPLAYLRQNDPDESDAHYLIENWPKNFDKVPYTAHSRQYDYGGPSAESNYQSWKREYGEGEGKTWWDLGDSGILVRLDILPTDQREAYDSLRDYPILDESDESELTMEIQDENWKDYGHRDTKQELVERADPDLAESVEGLFELLPERYFNDAYWEQVSQSGQGPEQDGGGYGTIFPRAFEEWDGLSFQALTDWLGLTDSVVRVRLSDAAFGPWKPTGRKGEKERTLRITPQQLEQSLGQSVSRAEANRLARGDEVQIKFGEQFPCENLYVECEYPWEEEPKEEEAGEKKKKKKSARACQRRAG